MEDEQLSLKWNNHKASFFNILKFLREKSNYTDATLAVEGKFYPVHKLVMSTCSEYFSDIFEKTSCKSPVIVLKDVSSHDIEALLDYMYLGEVNVSQNKLASLLKTAESLRIKGLAVPDKDEAELSKNPTGSHDDALRDCPPSKRRRHNSGNRSSHAAAPVSSPQKSASALVNHTDTPSISSHLTFNTKHDESPIGKVQMDDPQESITKKEEPPVVKLEVDDDVVEERFERENNYEGGASSDLDPLGDYGSDLSKTEHELDNYCSTSFPGPSLQHSGEGHWDEGDSSSFPPESYTGDISYQQGQGDVDWMHSPWAALLVVKLLLSALKRHT
ncbi:unnamed protein product [Meganyctiphanes norvegica]|uniref:BTB domain-containing protein n=1 Tax=Meganyctiphanes norvegica TaxID=48144 RepID=A0AAV2RSU9_MEGNR